MLDFTSVSTIDILTSGMVAQVLCAIVIYYILIRRYK
jgi:hypothetical protein